jgi:hypothetical protein
MIFICSRGGWEEFLFISSDSRRNEPKKTATPSPYIGDVAAPLVARSLR